MTSVPRRLPFSIASVLVSLVSLLSLVAGGCTKAADESDASPIQSKTTLGEVPFTVTFERMHRDYGVQGDGTSNDFSALNHLFHDLGEGRYADTVLGTMRVVLDFGAAKTYCALYDASTFTGRVPSDRCAYTGAAPAGASAFPAEATLSLTRGRVQFTLGAGTVLDASIAISGSLAGQYIGAYRSSDWLEPRETLDAKTMDPRGTSVSEGEDLAGAPVVVQLAGRGLASKNQAGIHLSRLAKFQFDQGEMHLALEDGLRFPMQEPKLSRVVAAKIARSSFQLSSDRKQITLRQEGIADSLKGLAANDIVRFENLSGNDSVFSGSAYFEYNRIVRVERGAGQLRILLSSPLAYDYGDFWLMQSAFLDDVRVVGSAEGGGSAITVLRSSYVQRLDIEQLQVRQMSASSVYDLTIDHVSGRIPHRPDPQGADIVLGFSYCRNGSLSALSAAGGRSKTDNANIKFMSALDLRVDHLESTDSEPLENQGEYAFFSDFYYTPYTAWAQNLAMTDVDGDRSQSGPSRAIWLTGLRRSTLRTFKTDGVLFVSHAGGDGARDTNTWSDVRATLGIEVRDARRQVFHSFEAGQMRITESSSIDLSSGVLQQATHPSDRCLWLQTSRDISVDDLLFYQPSSGSYCNGHSVYLQDVNGISLHRVSDKGRFDHAPQSRFRSIYFEGATAAEYPTLCRNSGITVTSSSLNFGGCS